MRREANQPSIQPRAGSFCCSRLHPAFQVRFRSISSDIDTQNAAATTRMLCSLYPDPLILRNPKLLDLHSIDRKQFDVKPSCTRSA